MAKDPKILIVCEQFVSGNAITALNLFSKWNNSSMYCISRYNDFFSENFSQAYLLGNKEVHYRFPFNMFSKSPCSRLYKSPEKVERNSISSSHRASKSWFRMLIKFLKFIGIFDKRLSYKLSDDLIKWIDEINPEYIYTPVGTVEMAYFILELIDRFPNIKLIYHGYDEWTKNSSQSFSKRYMKEGESLLLKIISKASVKMAISNKMAEYYSSYYNTKFYSFCNPVEEISEPVVSKKNIITFIGYIGSHNLSSIISLTKALSSSNNEDLQLSIYSNIDVELITMLKKIYPNIVVNGWIDHSRIPLVLRESRILFLPIGFEKHVVRFTRYSMSTKMAEYLASSTPILYLGPKDIAMTELLVNNEAAVVVTENDDKLILKGIQTLLSDDNMTKNISNNAYRLFKEHFEINKVAASFKQCILQ